MYNWVSNQAKYDRAVKELRASKLEVTEAAVLELYRKYGGLVLDADEVVADEAEEEVVAPKPRRARKNG